MNNFLDIFENYTLICAVTAWAIAQLIKFILTLAFSKTVDFKKFIATGGMPSSHTSTVCALATSIGLIEGFSSVSFSLAAILAVVVMVDATGVRRATGENAKVLNKLISDVFVEKNSEYFTKDLKELVGHKPIEVLCGAFLGILIPFIIRPF